MYKTLSAPLVVQVEATYRCPCKCRHCYNFLRSQAEARSLPSLSFWQMDRISAQLIKHNVFHVLVTGGEPFANKKVVFNGIEKLRSAGITVGVNSNLIPLRRDDARLLKQLGISSVLTSLLGPDEASHEAITLAKGSFRGTVRGIHLLQEAGVPVFANMVVSQANIHLLTPTAVFVKSLGIKAFYSTRAACPGNCFDFSELALSLEEFRAYLKELHQIGIDLSLRVGVLESYPLCGMKDVDLYPEFTGRRCLAGVTSMTIGADCMIRPCSHMDQVYGNAMDDELDEVWARMQDWRSGAFLPETCQSCKLLVRCGGGCRMEAKMIQGDISRLDPYASPNDVEYVAGLHLDKPEKKQGPLPEVFKINSGIRRRKESFGSVVFMGQRLGCYLNHDATEFIDGLKPDQPYPVANILEEYGDGTRAFLQGLWKKGLLAKV